MVTQSVPVQLTVARVLFLPLSQLFIHTFAVYLRTCVSWAGTEVAETPRRCRCRGEESFGEGETVTELLRFGTVAQGLTQTIGEK